MVLVGFKPDLWWPTGFLQCCDTVGLVIWPVKIVAKMTYYVSSGTLNPTHSLTLLIGWHSIWRKPVLAVPEVPAWGLCRENWKSRSFKQKVKVLSTYFRGILKLLRAVLWWVGIKIKRVCVCVCLCLLVKSPNAEFDTDMLKVTVLCVLACCVLKIWFHIGILWYIFASVSPVWAPGL